MKVHGLALDVRSAVGIAYGFDSPTSLATSRSAGEVVSCSARVLLHQALADSMYGAH